MRYIECKDQFEMFGLGMKRGILGVVCHKHRMWSWDRGLVENLD